jgi:NADH:ubiquinone oxidoreductase subunit 2 (subunit N)
MYMQEGEPEISGDGWLKLATGLTAVGTVALGIFAVPLFEWASQAVLKLF